MTKADLSARIHAIVADLLALEPHEVRDDSRLCDLTDDLGRLEILMAAEQLVDQEISDEDGEGLKTVADLISFLADLVGVAEVAA